jgi:hypothetical protein
VNPATFNDVNHFLLAQMCSQPSDRHENCEKSPRQQLGKAKEGNFFITSWDSASLMSQSKRKEKTFSGMKERKKEKKTLPAADKSE